MGGSGNVGCLQRAAPEAAAINFPMFYFFLPQPGFMFCCSSWGLMCFPVSSIFLFECFGFFILKLLSTKSASLFNSCLVISAQWMQTAGAAWVAVWEASRDIIWANSTVSPWPLCSFAPTAGLFRACHGRCWFLLTRTCKLALDVKACHTFSHLKAFQGEIWDASFYVHTLNFLCLASAFFFFNTYGDFFQYVLIETGDICIPSLGEDGDLTDIWFELACYFYFWLIVTTVPTAVSLLIADRHPEG